MLNERKIGVIFLLSIFMMSLYGKILDIGGLYKGIQNKGLPYPELAVLVAIGFQLIGIILILDNEFNLLKLRVKNKKIGKYLLITFTLMTIYFYHNMLIDKSQKISFFKNLSIIGGLLLI